MKKTDVTFKHEDMLTECCITYSDKITICEYALCHPDEKDFYSPLIGEHIAYTRAYIEYLKYVKDYEVKPELKALQDFYTQIDSSPKFNENSYEMKALRKRIHRLENELATIKGEIAIEKVGLKAYIASKDAYHNKIRERRNKGQI
jgi:hypothetical protein